MQTQVIVSAKDLEPFAKLKLLGEKRIHLAEVRAVNRALQGVKTDAVAIIKKEYNIKPTAIRKAIRIGRATAKMQEVSGSAFVTAKPIPLYSFSPQPKKVAKTAKMRPAGGVSVLVKKNRKAIPGSFIAEMKSGHTGVFKRTGQFGRIPQRTPRKVRPGGKSLERIQELLGPSIVGAVNENYNILYTAALDRFNKNLKSEINYELLKMGIGVK